MAELSSSRCTENPVLAGHWVVNRAESKQEQQKTKEGKTVEPKPPFHPRQPQLWRRMSRQPPHLQCLRQSLLKMRKPGSSGSSVRAGVKKTEEGGFMSLTALLHLTMYDRIVFSHCFQRFTFLSEYDYIFLSEYVWTDFRRSWLPDLAVPDLQLKYGCHWAPQDELSSQPTKSTELILHPEVVILSNFMYVYIKCPFISAKSVNWPFIHHFFHHFHVAHHWSLW